MFLEWQQIGKWLFDGTDIGDKVVADSAQNTSANYYGKDRFTNAADTPLMIMTAFRPSQNSKPAEAVVMRENGITFCRCRFTDKYDRNFTGTKYTSACGLKLLLDPNKTVGYDYPVLIKYKMRINNPDKVDGCSVGVGYLNNKIFVIDKKIVDGVYKLCIKSLNGNSEINYPLSQKILNGEWVDVEILWTPEKETVRLDGWSIGSDSNTRSPLNYATSITSYTVTYNTPENTYRSISSSTLPGFKGFDILTSYSHDLESPDFDIGEIEVRRIYERTITPPTIKITSEVIDDTTVRLTANGYTGVIPDYEAQEEPEEPEPDNNSNSGS